MERLSSNSCLPPFRMLGLQAVPPQPTRINPVLEGVVAAIRKPSELDAFLKNGLSLPSSQMSSI
jgi:hypothetical protein